MTTRRRRTPSEIDAEDDFQSGGLTSIVTNSVTTNSLYQPIVNLKQHWIAPIPQTDANYKKTDIFPSNNIDPTNSSELRRVATFGTGIQFPENSFRDSVELYSNSSTDLGSTHHTKFNIFNESNSNSIDGENMASRDRTKEFSGIVRSLKGNSANGVLPHNAGKGPKDLRNYADFMQRSKLIAGNISRTYAKLEKLTHLAKKRSLFDDSQDHEIQELTGIVRHDLSSLTKQLDDLQNRSKSTGSDLNGSSGHLQKHSTNLVISLETKVASITHKFRDVLEVRTESLKKQAERREQFAGGSVNRGLPPQAIAGYHQGSVLMADEAAAVTRSRPHENGGTVAISIADDSFEGATGQTNAYQQQLHLVEEQDHILESRADTMKTIESTIVELGQMFTHLATMVQEQEELVHRIDSNVDHADTNVEAAHGELLKYFRSVSSNRWLMFKVFGVLIVFFIIFVVFMA